MDEQDARQWVQREFDVPRETIDCLDRFVALLNYENRRQNLVSAATLANVWSRHLVDSAQLVRFANVERDWLDLGSGAGFPGLIIATITGASVTLVEQRRLRADFLSQGAEVLGVGDRCGIICSRLERVESHPFGNITARAFAPLPDLLDLAVRFSTEETRWILPKGRKAETELEAVQASWQGDFRLEPSLTDPDARIIVAERVRKRETRRG